MIEAERFFILFFELIATTIGLAVMCHSSKVQPKEMGDTQLDSTNINKSFRF